ncbi:hypothetical protein DFP72DRAFT_423968 [Ephemerocybe angulata]|uniref:Uncharacterized protein n=1 Tax=Ephemerocybe angulata TaxID=980116 RepID=A0A8H6IHZ3_9AGAR|nr:hypothetical protein DFP72DRAFT_423968 [Tulosesus angulatus]
MNKSTENSAHRGTRYWEYGTVQRFPLFSVKKHGTLAFFSSSPSVTSTTCIALLQKMATNARQYPGEIECGCCFDSTPTDRIIRCPAAHPLCVTCLAAHTTTQLDKSATKISCIDVTTGCSVPFDRTSYLPTSFGATKP